MGYMVELNTLLGVPKDFDTSTLEVGKLYTVVKDRERSFPLHIAMLLTLFTSDEKKMYKEKFLEAARKTGEVK